MGFDGSKWHNISVRCTDSRIDAYVDGRRACTIIDNQRSAGNCCIGGNMDASQYDNISVMPVAEWTVINETDPSVIWVGQWWYYYYPGSLFYNYDCTYSNVTGAAVTFPFYGKTGRVIGTKRSDCGYMDVFVDNIFKTTIDCYNTAENNKQVLYQTDELALDNHTIRTAVKGQKNPSSTNYTIIMEAFSSTTSPTCPAPGTNLALSATASASSVWSSSYTAAKANDANYITRWNSYTNSCWLELDFGKTVTFASTRLTEYETNRITGYRIQYYDGTWKDAYSGTTVGDSKVDTFPAVTGTKARLYVDTATNTPSIYEFEVYAARGDVDFNGDGAIDFGDVAIFCNYWLEQECNSCCGCDGVDLLHDNKIDFQDYAIFAE